MPQPITRLKTGLLAAVGAVIVGVAPVAALPAHADEAKAIDAYVYDVSVYGPISSVCGATENTLTWDIWLYDSGDEGPLHPVTLTVDGVAIQTLTPERDTATRFVGSYTTTNDSWSVNVLVDGERGLTTAWGPDGQPFTCTIEPTPTPTASPTSTAAPTPAPSATPTATTEPAIVATQPTQSGNSLTIPVIDGVVYVNADSGETLKGTVLLTSPLTITARSTSSTPVTGGPWTFVPASASSAPSATSTPAASPGAATQVTARTLAHTGQDDASLWLLGASALITGAGLTLVARTRLRGTSTHQCTH